MTTINPTKNKILYFQLDTTNPQKYFSSNDHYFRYKQYSKPYQLAVNELVKELAKIPNILGIRAIANNPKDLHQIDFELKLKTELVDEYWDKIQNLVIDYEWSLRDSTNESWYFKAEIVEKFSRVPEGAEVIASIDKLFDEEQRKFYSF